MKFGAGYFCGTLFTFHEPPKDFMTLEEAYAHAIELGLHEVDLIPVLEEHLEYHGWVFMGRYSMCDFYIVYDSRMTFCVGSEAPP